MMSRQHKRERANRTFWQCERGGVAIFFALSLTVLVAMIGSFVDYGLVIISRSAAQGAGDATALSIAVAPDGEDKTAVSRRYYNANFDHAVSGVDVAYEDLDIHYDSEVISVQSNADLQTYFLRVANQDSLPVQARTTIANSGSTFGSDQDVVIVADVSASMRQDDGTGRKRIEALRLAYDAFVTSLLANGNANTRLGLATYGGKLKAKMALTSNLSKAASYKQAIVSGGTTCGACGIKGGGEVLEGSPPPATTRDDGKPFSERKVMILMSDGVFKDPSFPEALQEGVDACEVLQDEGYAIYSVFLGDPAGLKAPTGWDEEYGDGDGDGKLDPGVIDYGPWGIGYYDLHVRPTMEACATKNADGELQYYVAETGDDLIGIFGSIGKQESKIIRIIE